jgi:hypothetical protein
MGMSTHIVGFRPANGPANDRWKKMKAVYDACNEAEIPIPAEVAGFFNGEPPDPTGVRVGLENSTCVQPWKSNDAEGFEVDVTKLPKDVTVIRFYNSW